MEELASTCAPGSECVSDTSASTASSVRLGRIIDQLRGLKCGKPEPEKSKEPMVDGSVEVERVDCMEISSDEEKLPVAPPNEPRTVRIAKILKAAKEKRLMAMKSGGHDGSVASSSCVPAAVVPEIPHEKTKEKNPYVLPHHVLWIHLIYFYVFSIVLCDWQMKLPNPKKNINISVDVVFLSNCILIFTNT